MKCLYLYLWKSQIFSIISCLLCWRLCLIGLWQARQQHGGDTVFLGQGWCNWAGDRPHSQHQERPSVRREHFAGYRSSEGRKHTDTGALHRYPRPLFFLSLCWLCSFILTLPPIQNSFYKQLYKQKNSEKFFKVFCDRMRLAQQEIRSTVSVNMFDFSCRKREDERNFYRTKLKKSKDESWLTETFHYVLKRDILH